MRRSAAFGLLLATLALVVLGDPRSAPAALWPSVLAISLAFLTKDIFLALLAGAFAGTLLLHSGNPAVAFLALLSEHLLASIADPWNVGVLVFTLMMGGLVEVLEFGGGMAALTSSLLERARDRRNAGLAITGIGWLFFVDGLANSMLIGKTMRPVADRVGMSREKLAFIVDSTASPIAGLALVSTWVAYEVSVIREGFRLSDAVWAADVAPFAVLVLSLPYRFYNYFALLFVFLTVWTLRDFGPMRAAEAGSRSAVPADRTPPRGRSGSIWLAAVPLAVLVASVVAGLYLDGGGPEVGLGLDGLITAMGAANASRVFVQATAFASLVAIVLALLSTPADSRKTGGDTRSEAAPGHAAGRTERGGVDARPAVADGPFGAFVLGMQRMFPPALILVFAWMLGSVIREMGTANVLVGSIGEDLPAGLVPTLVFVAAAVVSFSTGTSWGTMALVMPLAIPVAVALADSGPRPGPAVIATVGAVLAGAVFGDHCSPISDTTIVSAFSSGCDVMAHVTTQAPYAISAAVLAVAAGYLPGGFGLSPWLSLPLGAMLCVGWFLVAARKA